MENPTRTHWDTVYSAKPASSLGWYEPSPAPSLQLIARCALDSQDAILDAGSGASTLIPALIDLGYQQVIALDISPVALEKARQNLRTESAARVAWVVGDVTRPDDLATLPEITLWHDRAVFHFLTGEPQRQGYRAALLNTLRPGGFLVLATFAVGGVAMCSGLDVETYDAASLERFFVPDFRLLESFDYLYHTPSGDPRPYVYTLFQRI
jgi:EEF1A lysine methyltransferase 2